MDKENEIKLRMTENEYFQNIICTEITTAFVSGAEAVKINVWCSAAEKWKVLGHKSFKDLWQLFPYNLWRGDRVEFCSPITVIV